jgi:sulfhydrogenase subunit alpha
VPTSRPPRRIRPASKTTRAVRGRLDLDDEQLTWQCEQAIRNYDPCISCATHFLDLTVDRA